jgi:hypothetical protein
MIRIIETVQQNRQYIALYFMLYGITALARMFLLDDNIWILSNQPPTEVEYWFRFIGYIQLSAYMIVDTIGNYRATNPRVEVYAHHLVCGTGLVSSLASNGRIGAPLAVFGILECITVCRFIRDEITFAWSRIIVTILMRVPTCIVSIWYCNRLASYRPTDEYMLFEIMVWRAIVTSVLPFDGYLMTLYVKRLLRHYRHARIE